MKVKDVVCLAADLLGREDLSAAAEDLSGEPTGEIASLLRCYNFVENEIALDYFPLRFCEEFPASGGRIPFSRFSYAPVSVTEVRTGRRSLEFGCDQTDLHILSPVAEGEPVRVTYCYSPEEKKWEGECDFSCRISPRLVACGIASEYCLSRGKFSEAAMWEGKYRDALKAANAARKKLSMRSRRWV